MPHDYVANLVTVTKRNMIDQMACGYRTIRTAVVRIWHQFSGRAASRSQVLQNLTVLHLNCCSILHAPPSLQVILGAPENALAESENYLHSSRGAWEHLEVDESTGEVEWNVWEVCMCLPDWCTLCWWSKWTVTSITPSKAEFLLFLYYTSDGLHGMSSSNFGSSCLPENR
jgi:hypothetical protein